VTRTGWAVVVAAGVVAIAAKKGKKRVRLAQGVYREEVSSGSKPIGSLTE
jgi:hypothetical protein